MFESPTCTDGKSGLWWWYVSPSGLGSELWRDGLCKLSVVALVLRSVGGIGVGDLVPLALIGCADLLANALFATASSRGQVSIAAVLGSLYPVATILLARVVLTERLRTIQVAGVLCALVGAAVISL